MIDIEDIDTEAEFYKILGAQEDLPQVDVIFRKDMFDSSIGSQVGINSAGRVVVLTVMTQEAAKQQMNAWDAYEGHECPIAEHCIMTYASVSNEMVQMLFPHLDAEVIALPNDFDHPGDEDD